MYNEPVSAMTAVHGSTNDRRSCIERWR